MKSSKDNKKKDTKTEKKVPEPGKKLIPKITTQKETGKTLSTSSSTVSTTSTRPQTSKPVETKPDTKGTAKKPETTKPISIDPYKRFPKFMKIIEKKKFSGMNVIVQKRFNHWKTLTLLQKQQITEKTQKTIVTKKRLNIHRISETKKKPKQEDKKEDKKEEPKSTSEPKKLSPEEEQKIKKIKKFIESRIEAYETKKSVMKRYFDIWLGRRTVSLTRKETTTKNVVTKKRIYLIKEKSKPLLNEQEVEGEPGKTDGLKRIRTLPVRPSISITGTKTLEEKILQK